MVKPLERLLKGTPLIEIEARIISAIGRQRGYNGNDIYHSYLETYQHTDHVKRRDEFLKLYFHYKDTPIISTRMGQKHD